MAGPTYGQGFIELSPSLAGNFSSALGGILSGPLAKVAGGIGLTIGAAVAGGIALEKIGSTFDDAFDQIRIGTGATGDLLDGLKGDFKAVFTSVPTDTASAATAIADLNTRLGLTGTNLEDRASQFLELSRITKTDLGGNIESVTRAFGDWGVAEDQQGEKLDALFRASQATGIGVQDLASQMVAYGAPLRQLGFTYDQSAGLIGKFNREGVNGELVLGSMRIALGKMAREGEDAQSTFKRITGEIKDAGSASEANALSLELFGARAGPDMAAAIREGRFELGDLYDTIANGDETIMGAAEDTNDWRQSWQLFKNKILTKIEPIASKVFGGLTKLLENAWPVAEKLFGVIGSVGEAIGGLFSGGGIDTSGLTSLIAPLGSIFGTLRDVVSSVFGGIKEAISSNAGTIGHIFETLKTIVGSFAEYVKVVWRIFGPTILGTVKAVFGTLIKVIGHAFDIIKSIFDVVIGILTGDWSRAWEGIQSIVGSVWDAIVDILTGAWDVVKSIFDGALHSISEAVSNGFTAVVDWFRGLPGRIVNAIGNLGKTLWDIGGDLIRGLWEGIKAMGSWIADQLKSWVTSFIPGPIARALGISSPSKVAAKLGRAVPAGLAGGILADLPLVSAAAERMAAATLPHLEGRYVKAIAGATGKVATGYDSPSTRVFNFGDITITNPNDPEPSETSIARALAAAVSPYIN